MSHDIILRSSLRSAILILLNKKPKPISSMLLTYSRLNKFPTEKRIKVRICNSEQSITEKKKLHRIACYPVVPSKVKFFFLFFGFYFLPQWLNANVTPLWFESSLIEFSCLFFHFLSSDFISIYVWVSSFSVSNSCCFRCCWFAWHSYSNYGKISIWIFRCFSLFPLLFLFLFVQTNNICRR